MVLESLSTQARSDGRERHRWIVPAALAAILAFGVFLRFYHLGQSGVNDYYAAAVKSMLLFWKNFFYVAFEPCGSVSVDKPPLGFWIEAICAYFFGVNGFALALPNAIAGVLSVGWPMHASNSFRSKPAHNSRLKNIHGYNAIVPGR